MNKPRDGFWLSLVLATVIACVVSGVKLHGQDTTKAKPAPAVEKRVQFKDFVGSWDMQWGEFSKFKQVFWTDGGSDCLGSEMSYNFYGVWTCVRDDQVSIAETCYSVPDNERCGEEVEFTLAVKKSTWKDGRLLRVDLEGDYRGNPIKVTLSC